MKKIIIAAVVILVVIGIITAVAVITKNSMKNHILDGPGMERAPHDYINACSFSSGGGMEGGSEYIELKEQPDGTVLFSYYYCPYNGAEEETMEKTFPDRSVFGEIRNICQRTGVLTWGELDNSELILLDAPTDSISFTFFDTEQYAVNSGKELPESGAGLFGEIYNALISLK